VGHDAVENGPVVMLFIHITQEVLYRDRRLVLIQLHLDVPHRCLDQHDGVRRRWTACRNGKQAKGGKEIEQTLHGNSPNGHLRRTERIKTSSIGLSVLPLPVVVSVSTRRILSTTSIPSMTWPNTA